MFFFVFWCEGGSRDESEGNACVFRLGLALDAGRKRKSEEEGGRGRTSTKCDGIDFEKKKRGFQSRRVLYKRTARRVGFPFREEATAVCIAARRARRRERGHSLPHELGKEEMRGDKGTREKRKNEKL